MFREVEHQLIHSHKRYLFWSNTVLFFLTIIFVRSSVNRKIISRNVQAGIIGWLPLFRIRLLGWKNRRTRTNYYTWKDILHRNFIQGKNWVQKDEQYSIRLASQGVVPQAISIVGGWVGGWLLLSTTNTQPIQDPVQFEFVAQYHKISLPCPLLSYKLESL